MDCPSYWVTETYQLEPIKVPTSSSDVCLLSVSLDSGFPNFFSGIRVIIVVLENDPDFGDLILTERVNPAGILRCNYVHKPAINQEDSSLVDDSTSSESPLSPSAHRNALLGARRGRIADPFMALEPTICELVLQLVKGQHGSVVPQNLDRHNILRVFSHRSGHRDLPLRKLFDTIYPYNPTSNSVSICLEANHSFVDPTSPEGFALLHAPIFTFRIIPLTSVQRSRNQINRLPPGVLLRIVRFTLDSERDDRRKWGRMIVSYSLVQKSWSPLLLIAYKKIGRGLLIHRPVSLAAFLSRHPDIDKYITAFSQRDFEIGSSVGRQIPVFKILNAFTTIFRQSPYLVEITLDRTVLDHCADQLRTLHKVNTLSILRYSVFKHYPDASFFDFEQLLSIIQEWKDLKVLEVQCHLDIDDFYDYGEGESAAPPPQAPVLFALRSLRLSDGTYSASQLHRLISPSRNTLRTLRLVRVLGLTNSDLVEILSAVAHTVVHLAILSCNISIPPSQLSEEKAIDKTVSCMEKIESMHVSENLITASTITQRRRYHLSPSSLGCGSLVILFNSAVHWEVDDLTQAISQSGWERVVLLIPIGTFTPRTKYRLTTAGRSGGVNVGIQEIDPLLGWYF